MLPRDSHATLRAAPGPGLRGASGRPWAGRAQVGGPMHPPPAPGHDDRAAAHSFLQRRQARESRATLPCRGLVSCWGSWAHELTDVGLSGHDNGHVGICCAMRQEACSAKPGSLPPFQRSRKDHSPGLAAKLGRDFEPPGDTDQGTWAVCAAGAAGSEEGVARDPKARLWGPLTTRPRHLPWDPSHPQLGCPRGLSVPVLGTPRCPTRSRRVCHC